MHAYTYIYTCSSLSATLEYDNNSESPPTVGIDGRMTEVFRVKLNFVLHAVLPLSC